MKWRRFIPFWHRTFAAVVGAISAVGISATACAGLSESPTAVSALEATPTQSAATTVPIVPETVLATSPVVEPTAVAATTQPSNTTPTTAANVPTPTQPAVQTTTAQPTTTASPAGTAEVTAGALTLKHTATLRADNALIVDVKIEFNLALDYYIEYGNAEAGWLRKPRVGRFGKLFETALVRLQADLEYEYEVFGINRVDQAVVKSTGRFRTGPLPDALASLKFTQEGRPTSHIIMFDAETPNDEFLFAIDRDSNIIWYWFGPASGKSIEPFRRGLQGIKQRANFNLVFLSKVDGLFDMTPDGTMVHRLEHSSVVITDGGSDSGGSSTEDDSSEAGPHHDLVIFDKSRVLYLEQESRPYDDTANSGPANLLVAGDRLMMWDVLNETTKEVWNSFDYLSPEDRVKWRIVNRGGAQRPWADWTHANSVSIGTTENILVSNRHLNQVISIAPGFQEIEWKLGGPGSDFTFPDPDDQFYHQHSAYQLADGNVLVFDNGNDRPHGEGGEYSRALELNLDFEAMTATKVWEYRPKPDHYASKQSNIERLENGNTLVAFSAPDAEPMLTVEANQRGEEVWRHTFWSPTLVEHYRSHAFPSLNGEIPIRR